MRLTNAFEMQKPLSELAYEELKAHIITGTLAPGTKIRRVKVANELRTSRTPIRKALRKLEHEGLVTIVPRRGAYVTKIYTKDIIDVLEVRENLEGLAASLYATKVKSEDIIRLKDATDNYSRAVAENNFNDILKYDAEFHQIITEACGNNTLIRMLKSLHDVILRYRHVYYGKFKTLERLSGEHETILNAIESGHSDQAKKCMKTHISNIKNIIITIDS